MKDEGVVDCRLTIVDCGSSWVESQYRHAVASGLRYHSIE